MTIAVHDDADRDRLVAPVFEVADKISAQLAGVELLTALAALAECMGQALAAVPTPEAAADEWRKLRDLIPTLERLNRNHEAAAALLEALGQVKQ